MFGKLILNLVHINVHVDVIKQFYKFVISVLVKTTHL